MFCPRFSRTETSQDAWCQLLIVIDLSCVVTWALCHFASCKFQAFMQQVSSYHFTLNFSSSWEPTAFPLLMRTVNMLYCKISLDRDIPTSHINYLYKFARISFITRPPLSVFSTFMRKQVLHIVERCHFSPNHLIWSLNTPQFSKLTPAFPWPF